MTCTCKAVEANGGKPTVKSPGEAYISSNNNKLNPARTAALHSRHQFHQGMYAFLTLAGHSYSGLFAVLFSYKALQAFQCADTLVREKISSG